LQQPVQRRSAYILAVLAGDLRRWRLDDSARRTRRRPAAQSRYGLLCQAAGLGQSGCPRRDLPGERPQQRGLQTTAAGHLLVEGQRHQLPSPFVIAADERIVGLVGDPRSATGVFSRHRQRFITVCNGRSSEQPIVSGPCRRGQVVRACPAPPGGSSQGVEAVQWYSRLIGALPSRRRLASTPGVRWSAREPDVVGAGPTRKVLCRDDHLNRDGPLIGLPPGFPRPFRLSRCRPSRKKHGEALASRQIITSRVAARPRRGAPGLENSLPPPKVAGPQASTGTLKPEPPSSRLLFHGDPFLQSDLGAAAGFGVGAVPQDRIVGLPRHYRRAESKGAMRSPAAAEMSLFLLACRCGRALRIL